MSKIYYDWLIDCVENRKWSWPWIALCLVHGLDRSKRTRRELLDDLKRDYRKAAMRSESNEGSDGK